MFKKEMENEIRYVHMICSMYRWVVHTSNFPEEKKTERKLSVNVSWYAQLLGYIINNKLRKDQWRKKSHI